MEQYEYQPSFATDVSSAPDTQYLISRLDRYRLYQHELEPSLPTQPASFPAFHSFSDTLHDQDCLIPYHYDDPESQLPIDSQVYYNPSLPPIPSWAPTPYHRLIPVLAAPTPQPCLNPDEKAVLIKEATTEAYLKLYQFGELETRVDEKGVWELHCTAGCWVRTSIPSRIPLTSKGQFATLEAHARGKLCKGQLGHIQNSTIQESRIALATAFPTQSRVVSPSS